MAKPHTIRDLIYREYRKAALAPIIVIELALLALYFGTTSYLESRAMDILDSEASRNLGEIVVREARNIDTEIANVTTLSRVLQTENTRFFAQGAQAPAAASPPVFSFAPNGVFYKVNDNGGSSLWYSANTPIGESQRAKARATEVFDPLFRAVAQSDKKIVAVYFNSNDSMCRYYPWVPEFYNVFDPKMDIPKFNFYYLADAAHDPSRAPVWTAAYLDPAGQGWMASCVAPVYRGKVLEGVTGIDITIDAIIKNLLDLKLPWGGAAFLVDDDGVIIAMPEAIESTLGLKELRAQVYHSTVKLDTVKPEEFNLFKNKDASIAGQFRAVFSSEQLVNDFRIGDKEFFLTNSHIAATSWHAMILVDKAIVRQPIVELDLLTKRFGVVALVVMLLFYAAFFTVLLSRSRRVAETLSRPIRYLAQRSSEIRTNPSGPQMEREASNVEEITQLHENFSAMALQLASLYNDLDGKVRQRTLELEQANDELNEAYQQMAQQDKMASIGQLAAGVAHEINNPMSFIISNIETMRDSWNRLSAYLQAHDGRPHGDQSALREQLDIDYLLKDGPQLFQDTLEGTARVKGIVGELRSFARTSDSVEAADLNKLVESVLKITSSEMKNRIELELELGPVPMLRCNPGQISQVLLNLLVNALQAIPDKGTIRIQTRQEAEWVLFAVTDTGIGMPKSVKTRIFEPFFTTKKIGQGTGLGLSVSYAIVKQHGGKIDVQSEEGHGSTFTVRLPKVHAN